MHCKRWVALTTTQGASGPHLAKAEHGFGTELALVAAGGFQVEAAVADCRQQTNRVRPQRRRQHKYQV